MPFSQCPEDLSIEILAHLSLRTIAKILLVQKAWKTFIETHQETIYHNVAIFGGLGPSHGTSLTEESSALGLGSFEITGWKEFCRFRMQTERNWAGLGPSSLERISTTGSNVFCRKGIPGKNRAVVSSLAGGIAVYDENVIVWGLPESYLPDPLKFVYDAGYLIFSRAGKNMIEIWHDGSHPLGPISTVFPPSTEQEAVVKASAAEYAAARHFYPAAAIPVPSEPQNITMNYPILVAATSSAVYVWNIQTAELMYSLNHEMSCPGLDPFLLSHRRASSVVCLTRDWKLWKKYCTGCPTSPTYVRRRIPGGGSLAADVVPQTARVVELEGTVYTSRNLWMRDDTGDSIFQTPDTRRQRHPARDPRGSADIQRLRRREDSRIVRCHRFSVSRSHSR
ncbi:hypothetical protein DFH08DRAFT_421014 [Mycena albidolilacea]|uniref:F-box domain-containing protein n=1 Tax=Mycena albidolilacea TaxID=1033008 RepID=A0AAD6ZBY8_9AGAR|nr:hypothetical protein DFH08DRAFT_421014 [Mycena albidolilacea]